ncbi:MAG TPA: flagellar motor protein MotA, partial [Rhizobiales bacterium]|nr:flagellar motor protein MotA [Hyphomicrobiales bacterium]
MSMDDLDDGNVLDLPRVYLVKMMVFILLVAIMAAVLYPQFKKAFMTNPGLNGMIVVVLLLGIGYALRMVWRLFREVNWVNHFRVADPGLEIPYSPNLLAPMEALLANRQGATVLSPTTLRSLLDSLASRLDEARDISRYMIGLLVFLGLLGTFWGLLQTVASVGNVIQSLDVGSADSSTIFDDLKSGLEAPLAGMGTSFSSSLFGLSGSLILGFLDLQASQAQNRFYNSLEDWLASLTDIEIGEGGQATVP